jgi:hypothetical protein
LPTAVLCTSSQNTERERLRKQKHKIPMTELLLHAPEPERVADWLYDWFVALKLPFRKCLIPLAHNWAFESSFLKAWLGVEQTDLIFHSHARDGMLYAISLNDKAAFAGEPARSTFKSASRPCAQLGIVNTGPHDAFGRCVLCQAEVYHTMLRMF